METLSTSSQFLTCGLHCSSNIAANKAPCSMTSEMITIRFVFTPPREPRFCTMCTPKHVASMRSVPYHMSPVSTFAKGKLRFCMKSNQMNTVFSPGFVRSSYAASACRLADLAEYYFPAVYYYPKWAGAHKFRRTFRDPSGILPGRFRETSCLRRVGAKAKLLLT